jgi:hypothetical protein
LEVSRATIHEVLYESLRLSAYKIQLVQQLYPGDCIKRQLYAEEMLDRNDHGAGEATFCVSGKVHKHSVRSWGTENLHISDSLKVDVLL